jgi:hypothetical protein
MTGFFKWLLAGSIGGLVGAAIWAGISYATNYEVGWIAWGVGFLVGYCVGYASSDCEDGFAPGLTAGALAIGAVLLGKFAAAHFLAASIAGGLTIPPVVPDDMIASLADDIAKDRLAKGQSVKFSARANHRNRHQAGRLSPRHLAGRGTAVERHQPRGPAKTDGCSERRDETDDPGARWRDAAERLFGELWDFRCSLVLSRRGDRI